jgi:indolepyruvate decarboxylase
LLPDVGLDDYLDGLIKQTAGQTFPGQWAKRPERILELSRPDDAITYQGFYDFTAPQINSDSIILGGTGFNLWGSVLLEICEADSFITQAAYTDIGYVTPAAVGASFARPDQKVVVFAGDGGFQMTAQSLSSMARYGQDTLIFLINNDVYGIEQWLAAPAAFGNDDPFLPLVELARWNYSELPHAFGNSGRGWKVSTYAELAKATEEALQHKGGPALIQVVVEPKSLPTLAKWRVPVS